MIKRSWCAGGERILTVFETRLTQSIKSLDFTKMLESSNVSPALDTAHFTHAQALQQTGGLLAHGPLLRHPHSLLQCIDAKPSICVLQVDRVISEADGYQPHLVAPEMGYRRLLQECLILFKVCALSVA